MKQNILILAPHPDDEILGCFGAIKHHLRQKDHVVFIYMTAGERGNTRLSPLDLSKTRMKEAKAVMKYLGIAQCHWLGLPDGKISCNASSVDLLGTIIANTPPVCLYVPHEKEAHRDHRTSWKIARAALRSAAEEYPVELIAYEVWTPLSRFNRVVDISTWIREKRTCLRLYQSQMKQLRYDEAIIGLNRYRGVITTKGDYCEVYDCCRVQGARVRKIKPGDIHDFLP